jgi:hypothetical protein
MSLEEISIKGVLSMRKVIAGLFITLDGVVESPDKWQEHFDEDMGQAMMEQLAPAGRCPAGARDLSGVGLLLAHCYG